MIDFLVFVFNVIWALLLLAVILVLSPLIFIVVAISDIYRYFRG